MNSLRLGLDDGPQRPKPSSNPGIWIRNNKPDHGKSANLPALTSFPWCYGPEFVAKELRKWLARTGAATLYIEPGSPWENGYCESFNSKLRDEFLNGEIFYSLKEVQILAERWRIYYNTERPHSSLGYRPPAPVAWQIEAPLGHGKVESKQSFPLFHAPDCGGELSNSPSALH
jgi:putative transposase